MEFGPVFLAGYVVVVEVHVSCSSICCRVPESVASKESASKPWKRLEDSRRAESFESFCDLWLAQDSNIQVDVDVVAVKTFFSPSDAIEIHGFSEHGIRVLTDGLLVEHVMTIPCFHGESLRFYYSVMYSLRYTRQFKAESDRIGSTGCL